MRSNRLAQRLARALMALGLGIGALAVGFWVFDVRLEVPEWMWRIALAKLALVGSVGMLALGAIMLRYLRRSEPHPPEEISALPNDPQAMLGAPPWSAAPREQEPVSQRITTPPEQRTP